MIIWFPKLAAGALSPYWAYPRSSRYCSWVGIWRFLGNTHGDPWGWHDDLVCLAMYPGSQGF
jgi:hypothetical protein